MKEVELERIAQTCNEYSDFFKNFLDKELVLICHENELDRFFFKQLEKYRPKKKRNPGRMD